MWVTVGSIASTHSALNLAHYSLHPLQKQDAPISNQELWQQGASLSSSGYCHDGFALRTERRHAVRRRGEVETHDKTRLADEQAQVVRVAVDQAMGQQK